MLEIVFKCFEFNNSVRVKERPQRPLANMNIADLKDQPFFSYMGLMLQDAECLLGAP